MWRSKCSCSHQPVGLAKHKDRKHIVCLPATIKLKIVLSFSFVISCFMLKVHPSCVMFYFPLPVFVCFPALITPTALVRFKLTYCSVTCLPRSVLHLGPTCYICSALKHKFDTAAAESIKNQTNQEPI